jgi:curli biogenesis system outer membrane secretion channel CsgG
VVCCGSSVAALATFDLRQRFRKRNMKMHLKGKYGRLPITMVLLSLMATGCATQTPPVTQKEAPGSIAAQQEAQRVVLAETPTAPTLKRKIALGRITNETSYGQSLLRDRHDDPLGKQVTDLLSKALTESGAYLVFERPDISRLEAESRLTGSELDIIGVDALIIGSLTEFGRKTVGESGFLSASKRQVAFAKVDLRIVDTSTAQVLFATSGAGEVSTETVSAMGFGSRAGFDGTLNDAAIRQAVSEAVSRLSFQMSSRPWQTAILRLDGERMFISGGKSQGINPGMGFEIHTRGEVIRSPQTGANITLPGRQIASIRIDANFGDTELNEGSVGSIVSGTLANYAVDDLVVRFSGAR